MSLPETMKAPPGARPRKGVMLISPVRFLLSDHARYITGHILVVDGGTTLTSPEHDSQ